MDSPFVTYGDVKTRRVQALPSLEVTGTVGGMGDGKDWANYWRDVCAPRLKAKKVEFGRGFPEWRIANAVGKLVEKPPQRSLVAMWLNGRREPYISQFLALCQVLELDPQKVLEPAGQKRDKVPLARVNERAALQRKVTRKRRRTNQ